MMNIKSTCLAFGILSLMLLSSQDLFSQKYEAINLDELLEASNKSAEALSGDEVEEVRSLVYDLNPTIFINDSGVKVFGNEIPVRAELNSINYELLTSLNSDFSAVKMLVLKINDQTKLNGTLDLSTLEAFKNLKYILVECSFNCSISKIGKMFQNANGTTILYQIATPE